jgi:hypothetical protein
VKGDELLFYSFFNFTVDSSGWSVPHSSGFTSGKKPHYSFYRRLDDCTGEKICDLLK